MSEKRSRLRPKHQRLALVVVAIVALVVYYVRRSGTEELV